MKTKKKITMLMAVAIFAVTATFSSVSAINVSAPVNASYAYIFYQNCCGHFTVDLTVCPFCAHPVQN